MLKISGLDKLQKRLDTIANNAEKLHGTHDVPVVELLTPSFVSQHTNCKTAEEFFEKSGFKIETSADLEAIPDEEWDEYIRSVSTFNDWESMLAEAAKGWAVKRLGI